MGNDQSRSAGSQDQAAEERPPDYYQLLQVDEDAGFDEIKVRRVTNRLGLFVTHAHHPHRNHTENWL
jgi:DnaJ family protein A protein 5